jgi:hypothetical protein
VSAGQILGAAILATAFIAVFAIMARIIGWRPATMIIGGAALFTALISTAIHLLVGAK